MSDSSFAAEDIAASSRWSSIALGEVVEVMDNRRRPITKSDRKSGPYPYYGATGVVDRVNDYLFDEELVLVGEDGAKWGAGDESAFAISGKSWINNHAHVLKPDREQVLDAWLIYFLNVADLSGFVSGLTVPKLNQGRLREIPVPLPPLDEQKRIVEKLDQAFAALDRARAHAEANLTDADALFESELLAAFAQAAAGVEQIGFDKLCEAITPKAKIKRAGYLKEGRFPIVSQEAEKVSGYWNEPDDLIGLSSPVVVFGDHTCCLKYIDFDFVVGADGTKVLKPRQGILAAYLYCGLRSQPIKSSGYARHFRFLREKTLPDIPLEEQEQLTLRLDEIEQSCRQLSEHYKSKLADIATLRQSLLQQAFAGQL